MIISKKRRCLILIKIITVFWVVSIIGRRM